jgi:hypothetical protein
MTTYSNPPLVSILTPAYNSAAYISETIESVRAQTFPDFEVIVADDGSSDDTIGVVQRIAERDPRVIVISSPHGGPATARNSALAIARGKFMALLDSDDLYMPTYLADQLQIAERCPGSGIVSANAISLGGELDGRPLWRATTGLRTVAVHDLIAEDNSVLVMSLFRRKVFERVGGFNPQFNGNEDYEFWLRAANAGFGIVQNRQPLAYYRRRPGSVSSDEARTGEGIIRVLESTASWNGPIERERELIAEKIATMRDYLARVRLRESLSRRDGQNAARSLKHLSELRSSVCLAVAAKVTKKWPELLIRAYGWRRALRAS